MISIFSNAMDRHVDGHFMKDPSGRLVFLPFGLKKQAYFVDSKSDEEKIRAFVKFYRSIAAMISMLSFPIIYLPGFLLNSSTVTMPLRNRVRADIAVLSCIVLVLVALTWMLWSLYKDTVPGFTSSLPEVGPDLKTQLIAACPPSGRQRLLLASLGAALLLMGIGIFAATRYSRPRPNCPPTDTSSTQSQ